MKHTMKRSMSFVLALCMVLGLVILPDVTEAHAEGESLLSTPVYSHDMDEINTSYVPKDWTRSGQFSYASKIVTDAESGRTYYHMERKAEGTTTANADSYASYKNTTTYGAAVLRCDFMVDTDCTTWTVYLPIFAASANARTIGFNIDHNSKINGEAVVMGKWYTCELVYEGPNTKKWTAYIDGSVFKTSTTTASLQYINMGLCKSFGNSGANKNNETISGLGVGLCIDNLAVYNYVAGTNFAAAEESYTVAVDSTVATGWTKTSTDAYLPSVTYTSSDETVATVDENGIVTGLKAGEVTITATPSASSNMLPATTTVTVTGGEEEDSNIEIAGTTMTLGSNLDMNFLIQEPATVPEGCYAKIVKTDAAGAEEVQTVAYEDWDYNATYQLKYATFTGIAAKEMGDQVAITIYNSEGTAISETYTDTVAAYVGRLMNLDETSATLKKVCEDMLIYGAAAQTKWGYDTENLVSTGTAEANTAENTSVRDAAWVGSSLVLESEILMKAYFNVEGTSWKVTYTDHYGNEKTLEGTEFGVDEAYPNYKYVPITGLCIADINTVVTVTVTTAEGEVTGTDSIASFVARSVEGDIYNAIMQFGASAYAYFRETEQ